jgi:tetratricopeptide (TPR) repeat protein
MWLSRAYELTGRLDDAIREGERTVRQDPLNQWALASLARTYAIAGRDTDTKKLLADLDGLSQRRYISPYGIALVHTALGDVDQAFAYIDRALEDRTPDLVYLRFEPRIDPLRNDPRFRQILSRVGHVTKDALSK